ncbi:MAG: hypothetical protein AB7Q42_07545 [Acidimicrobiia bacterium]
MDEISAQVPVLALADWPVDQLERVWRLSSGAVRTGVDRDPAQRHRLEAQAAAVGEELVRRGHL